MPAPAASQSSSLVFLTAQAPLLLGPSEPAIPRTHQARMVAADQWYPAHLHDTQAFRIIPSALMTQDLEDELTRNRDFVRHKLSRASSSHHHRAGSRWMETAPHPIWRQHRNGEVGTVPRLPHQGRCRRFSRIFLQPLTLHRCFRPATFLQHTRRRRVSRMKAGVLLALNLRTQAREQAGTADPLRSNQAKQHTK